MTIDTWLANACADADRRGLPELKPLLVSLADSTRALRSVGWEADEPPEHVEPAAPDDDGAAR